MTTSNPARPLAEFPQQKNLTADSGAQGSVPGPMSQQDGADCHGHDMHPQKFVQLVGCHESNPAGDRAA
jgi:hypothetical protein